MDVAELSGGATSPGTIGPQMTLAQQSESIAADQSYALLNFPLGEEHQNAENEEGNVQTFSYGRYDCTIDADPLVSSPGTETVVTTPVLWAGRSERTVGMTSHVCTVAVIRSSPIHAPRALPEAPLSPGNYGGCEVTKDQIASYGNYREIDASDGDGFESIAQTSETSVLMNFEAERRQERITFLLGVLLGIFTGLFASAVMAIALAFGNP